MPKNLAIAFFKSLHDGGLVHTPIATIQSSLRKIFWYGFQIVHTDDLFSSILGACAMLKPGGSPGEISWSLNVVLSFESELDHSLASYPYYCGEPSSFLPWLQGPGSPRCPPCLAMRATSLSFLQGRWISVPTSVSWPKMRIRRAVGDPGGLSLSLSSRPCVRSPPFGPIWMELLP